MNHSETATRKRHGAPRGLSEPHVAIIGGGAIGTRHIESLARLERPFTLHIVDPSTAARDRAVQAFMRARGTTPVRVHALANSDAFEVVPDVAVVATVSRGRRSVIEDLLGRGVRRFILEKVLFTRLVDYDAVEAAFERTSASAWVNCPRRSYPGFAAIAATLDGRSFDYVVHGSGWGMGCNLIHHLDEFAALAGRTDVALRADRLRTGTVPAKRPGYVEFLGTISGQAGEFRFTGHCGAGPVTDKVVTIIAEGARLHVSRQEQTLTVENGGDAVVVPYPTPLHSESTSRHVEAILEGRAPDLPDYHTSARLHRAMISAFLSHLRRSEEDPRINECPVT